MEERIRKILEIYRTALEYDYQASYNRNNKGTTLWMKFLKPLGLAEIKKDRDPVNFEKILFIFLIDGRWEEILIDY